VTPAGPLRRRGSPLPEAAGDTSADDAAGELLVRTLLRRVVDRWLATGYAFMVLVYVYASKLAVSKAWSDLAEAILKT
jgi:hypothetical protein